MNTEIKELVAEGKVDEALEKLVNFLGDKVDQYSPLYRAAQVAQSEYNQTKEKELQGILTEEQIRLANNIAINRVLEILEQVDRGGSSATAPTPRVQWWWFAIGGVVLTTLAFLFFRKNPGNTDKPVVIPISSVDTLKSGPIVDCPEFAEGTKYGIAIFDFTTRTGEKDNADVFLVQEIDKIFDNNNFAGDAILIEDYKGSLDLTMAKNLLKGCDVQMVIWGQVFSQEEIEINFYAPNLEQKNKNSLENDLLGREQSNFQAGIKQAALLIASRVLVDNDDDGAIAVAEKAYEETVKKSNSVAAKSAKKSNAESMATMTLANAHARKKDYNKAIPLYNNILDKKPLDTFARKNLAIVQIKTNKIDVAIKNLDTLRDQQKKEDPQFLNKVGEELSEKGWVRKGAEFKKDAQRIMQRDSVNLRIKQ